MNLTGDEVLKIVVCHGPKKSTVEILPSAKLKELNEKIESLLSIKRDGQKLIYKGKLLNDPEQSISSFGIKNGDIIMALGKIVRHERDLLLSELDKIGNSVKNIEIKVQNITKDVESFDAETQERKNVIQIKDSMQNLLTANEELMRLLETLDALQIEVNSEIVRSRRKTIVNFIQQLMDQVDKEYRRFEAYITVS